MNFHSLILKNDNISSKTGINRNGEPKSVRICIILSLSEEARKVSEAVAYLHRHYPNLVVDGPLQADFATNPSMMENSFPFSKLINSKVNTLIFPNLDAANITYKLMKELNNNLSVGPIMMGMALPVHILQLGASVEEIVNMTAVAVVDAQQRKQSEA